jgi:predicted GNAT superfamily acetyltransferase
MRAVAVEADVRPLVEMADLGSAADLLAAIWGYPVGQGPATPELLRALSHSGNYVAGAWVDGDLIGASAGWLGRHAGEDAVHLHSHISGVVADRQGGRVGYALKQHQRQWALERDVTTIEWTFDPLVRRNAYFNLAKLGAAVVAFEPDFYGTMRDAINAGEKTDRVVARWDLRAGPVATSDRSEADGEVILRADDADRPVADAGGRAHTLRAWIPEDYLRLRESDPGLARGWRQALRETVGAALQHGYVAVGMTRDGWYTLVRSESP